MGKRVISIMLIILLIISSVLMFLCFMKTNTPKTTVQEVVLLNVFTYIAIAIFILNEKRGRR